MALFDAALQARLFQPVISKELGKMNCPVTPQIDIAARLLEQNHYQRLGLTTNAVRRSELKQAYRSRLELLEQYRQELDELQYRQARRLLHQAITVLSHKQSRREYDNQLLAARNRVQATLVSEPPLEGDSSTRHVGETSSTENATPPRNSPFDSRYTLGEILSQSERCAIYQAVDRRLNREVVVKRIDRGLLCNEEHARLFREEAELFARSNASNLVKILDYDAKLGAIVLEKMKYDLSEMVQQRPLDPDSVREILRDALSGLAWLHDQAMAHGRVELTHVLVDDNGGVKLAVSPGMTGVSTSFRPGRYTRHVAPELLNRQYFGPPGLAADIYAMGFVALELLCGKALAGRVNPAIEAESDSSKGWLLWHASPSEHLPHLKTLVDGLPDDLNTVLTRMTTKQQNERWTDARQCLTALQHVPTRSSSAIEIQTDNLDPQSFGVEILGTPPSLHAEYEASESISWRDILRDPKLLAHPLARSKAMSLVLCCVCCMAMLLLLFSPDTAPLDNATAGLEDQPRSSPLLSEIDLLANQELDLVTDEVPPEPIPLPMPAPTPVVSSVLIEEVPVEEPPLIATAEIQHVEEPIELPNDVEEVQYWPTFPAFEWQYGGNSDLAVRQYKFVEKELWKISTVASASLGKEYPFQLGNRIHDPRAPFSLALHARGKGESHVSREMCEKSLRDARQLRVPYMLPLILITHLLCESSEHAAALSYCRETLRWHSLAAERTGDPRFEESTLAIAWWTGLVVGFVEDVKGSAMAATADTRGAEQFVKQTVSTEQFEIYLHARRYVKQRYSELSESRIRLVDKDVRQRQPSEDARRASESMGYTANTTSLYGQEELTYETRASEVSTIVETHRQVHHRVASPVSLSSYYPLDIRSLADQSRYTLRTPSNKSTIPKNIDPPKNELERLAAKNKVTAHD